MKKFLLVFMLVVMLTISVNAQDSVSDDTQAVIDRVVALITESFEYNDFEFSSIEERGNNAIIADSAGNPLIEIAELTSIALEGVVIQGENPSGYASIFTDHRESFAGTPFEYTVTGELVYVDENLYANVTSAETDTPSALDFISQGEWVLAGEDANLADILVFDRFADFFADEEDDDRRLDQIIGSLITDETLITVGEQEVDGIVYEHIVLEFDSSGIVVFLSEQMEMEQEGNPVVGFMLEALASVDSEDFSFVIELLVNEDDLLAGVDVSIAFTLVGDLANIELGLGDLEGTLTVDLSIRQAELRTAINAGAEPITLPE
jgi:hypothetical protein